MVWDNGRHYACIIWSGSYWQPEGFGRVYATYGGIFILMALFWAWKVDGFKPDHYDIIGAVIAVFGVCIIYFTPRN